MTKRVRRINVTETQDWRFGLVGVGCLITVGEVLLSVINMVTWTQSPDECFKSFSLCHFKSRHCMSLPVKSQNSEPLNKLPSSYSILKKSSWPSIINLPAPQTQKFEVSFGFAMLESSQDWLFIPACS